MASIQAFVLWFPAERTAIMIALAYSMGGLGALTASVPLEFALRSFDWRQIFQGLAAATLALAAVFALVVPELPGTRRAMPLRELFAGPCEHRPRCGSLARRRLRRREPVRRARALTLWITTWQARRRRLRPRRGGRRRWRGAVALLRRLPFFGRLADARARQGRSMLPLLAGGVAVSGVCLALITLGVTQGAVLLWAGCIFCGTGSTLAHAIATRRFPREMAGRVNTALNTFTFFGVFVGQWVSGAILSLWPPTATGWEPQSYFAFGAVMVQAGRLAWLWSAGAFAS
jgi:MFS family permease